MSELWAELLIDAPAELEDAVAAYVALRGGGVEVRDAETLLKPPAPGRVVLVTYVRPDEAEAWLAEIGGRFTGLVMTIALRSDDEWRDVWKQYFKPRRIGRRLVVRPTWESYTAQPGDLVLELDPGRAFGTGNHESTQLVMEAMEELLAPRRFLDVGTGSGILSLAATALWPEARGVAIDVDPEAVACARENLAKVLDRVAIGGEPVEKVEGTFELVMANVSAEVLLDIVDALAARVAPGGRLILSGMLRSSADDVAARYAHKGLALDRMLDRGEWRAAQLSRPS